MVSLSGMVTLDSVDLRVTTFLPLVTEEHNIKKIACVFEDKS